MKTNEKDLNIFANSSELVTALSKHFVELANSSISKRGFFRVALSGGSTPKILYQALASPPYNKEIAWDKVFFFWSDERCVPHNNPESNYLMAYENLLSKIPVPKSNIFPTEGQDKNPQASAQQYEVEIKKYFQLSGHDFPAFDLILLGLGPDGHTASLFPGSEALSETKKLVAANFVEKFNSWRLTFTYPTINQAHNVVFLVSGAEKAEIITQIFQSPGKIPLPAQLVHPVSGKLEWYLDKNAARLLNLSHSIN
jgi:6-phosphogluconolactonase